MRLLPIEFDSRGYRFKQLDRNEFCAIYSKQIKLTDESLGEDHFEVIDILSHNGREIHGNVQPPSEFFPSDNMWGKNGWSFTNRESAFVRFSERTKVRLDKHNLMKNSELGVSESNL